jgi:23S rRNA pseudouridine1911/1915/1917 synthase
LRHDVTPEEVGKRVDVTVARLSRASRALVADAIKRGAVLVNGEPAKAGRALEEGDAIEYAVEERRPLTAEPEDIPLAIVYEDDDLMVVDKPAGMVTHPAHGSTSGTLVNALLAHVNLPGDSLRPGLVHRLDRDTSGLLVVAKTDEALSKLGIAMKARRIKREYLGLVHGVPEHARGTIEGAIGRDPHNRLKFAVVADGKPAVTHYELSRTHQIRVHLAAMKHAIVNDPIYGREEPRLGLTGQALHAWRLAFVHPRTGVEMDFEVDPPPEYVRAKAMLRGDEA